VKNWVLVVKVEVWASLPTGFFAPLWWWWESSATCDTWSRWTPWLVGPNGSQETNA
jgi:hypothetical protein